MTGTSIPSSRWRAAVVLALLVLSAHQVSASSGPLTWSVAVSPQLLVPTGPMNDGFGPSPSGWVAVGIRGESVGGRLSFHYSGLRSQVADHETTSRTFGAAAELLTNDVFGTRRAYFTAGLGLLTRELTEGRQIREKVQDSYGFPYYQLSRIAYDERAVDVLGRLGLGVWVLRGARWGLSLESVYEASFSVLEPEELDLNLRVDESLRFGAAFRLDLN